ncbi:DUF2612 domain-containing protein [Anaerosolibacter sp.]|uniref:DUF2612 domain-containing protein n=1 Tax=Anaerosolibacter sp. TaxID=1872527 RepID=UPI0039EE4FD0
MTSYENMNSKLLSQFKKAVVLNAILQAFGRQMDEIKVALSDLSSKRGLSGSVGKQLDGLGEIVQITRKPRGFFQELSNDEDYRILVGAKAIKNTWLGDLPGAIELWDSVFPDRKLALMDNYDMTMTALLTGTEPVGIQKDLILSGFIIPKPTAVNMNYKFSEGKAFGFGVDNDTIGGFDSGYWARDLI